MPGPVGVHGFWLKHLPSVLRKLLDYFNEFITTRGSSLLETPSLLHGRTTLIMKCKAKGAIPSNYRPITCLSTTWKLFSSIVSNLIHSHLQAHGLLWYEQKGCSLGSRGTKDQLLIDRLMLTDSKNHRKNLFMGWIDFWKAYDSVPHDWILKCLSLYRICGELVSVISSSMSMWKTTLTCGGQVLGNVTICQGIFQGDSLSPLLFVLLLLPLSIILRDTNKGYTVNRSLPKVNHLLYLDDVKLYARSHAELESLINTVEIFSTDICMTFGFDKCRTMSILRGKMSAGPDTVLPIGCIHHLNFEETYKYLGVLEADGVKHDVMKTQLTTTYKHQICKILRSHLNSKNVIQAIYSYAVPLVRYSAGLVKWTQVEMYKLDVQTRKLLILHCAFNRNGDIDRLYVHRALGGRGLLSVSDTIQKECNSLGYYLNKSTEPLL